MSYVVRYRCGGPDRWLAWQDTYSFWYALITATHAEKFASVGIAERGWQGFASEFGLANAEHWVEEAPEC